jgi:hypothetical protein
MGDNMVDILRFSRKTAFTPETIHILAAALDETWESLRQSGSRLARPAYSRAMREVVAKRIIEMAQRGMQDREALVTGALRFIAANYEWDRRVIFVLNDGKQTGTKQAGSFHRASVGLRSRSTGTIVIHGHQ